MESYTQCHTIGTGGCRGNRCPPQLPDTVPTEEGALLEPLSVAINAVRRGGVGTTFRGPQRRTLRLRHTCVAAMGVGVAVCAGLGSTVLVTGAGTVGLLACMVARAAGATTVVCTDPVATKRRLASSLGVSAALAPCPVTDAVLHTHGGAGFDVCIECSGAEAALKLCVRSHAVAGTSRTESDPRNHVRLKLVLPAAAWWLSPTNTARAQACLFKARRAGRSIFEGCIVYVRLHQYGLPRATPSPERVLVHVLVPASTRIRTRWRRRWQQHGACY